MTVAALTGTARVPSFSRCAAISRADNRSPIATASSAERGGASPSMQTPFAMRSNSAISLCSSSSTGSRTPAGSSSWHVSTWRFRSFSMSDSTPALSHASARRSTSSSRSVTFDMADTTIATGRCRRCSAEIAAAARIRSAEPTLVPPNFIISKSFT